MPSTRPVWLSSLVTPAASRPSAPRISFCLIRASFNPVRCLSKQSSQRERYWEPPIYVRRSDLSWGRPPWKFEQTCTTSDIHLEEQVQALCDSSGTEEIIGVVFAVERPSGPGLWVKGSVRTVLQLQCEWCSKKYSQAVDTPFQVWLNSEAYTDAQVQSAEELAFPSTDDVCDLSPAIADAISLTLPSVSLCGGTSCENLVDQPMQWASTATSSYKSSPFASLLASSSKIKGAGPLKGSIRDKQCSSERSSTGK